MGQYRRKIKKGERWYYQGMYCGQRYCSKAIYLTKQEAKNKERDYLTGLDEQIRNPTNDMSLFDLMVDRLDYLKLKKSQFYYKENRRYFKKALDFWGKGRLVGEITKKNVNELLMFEAKRLIQTGRTNHKINAMIRCLKALFNYGARAHDLKSLNPVRFAEFYPIDIKLKKIPTDGEINAVRGKLSYGQTLLFDFVDQTGCRIMEAIRFKAEDIDGDLITLWTRKSKNSNLTPRRIPMPDCLKGFKGKGRPFKDWEAYPRFLEDAADHKWNWHNLRHRRASIWANSGMTLIEIMQRLGHSNVQTTQRYLQLLGFTRF
jgi:integrase